MTGCIKRFREPHAARGPQIVDLRFIAIKRKYKYSVTFSRKDIVKQYIIILYIAIQNFSFQQWARYHVFYWRTARRHGGVRWTDTDKMKLTWQVNVTCTEFVGPPDERTVNYGSSVCTSCEACIQVHRFRRSRKCLMLPTANVEVEKERLIKSAAESSEIYSSRPYCTGD